MYMCLEINFKIINNYIKISYFSKRWKGMFSIMGRHFKMKTVLNLNS